MLVLSWTFKSTSVDYWEVKYNDSRLLFAHTSLEDSIITLDCRNFKDNDSIKYIYHPCYNDDHMNYLTKLYAVTPQNIKFLLAEQKSNGYWFGDFPVMILQKISDSCKCDILIFEQNVTSSWINEKGRKKSDKAQSWRMFKIKLTK